MWIHVSGIYPELTHVLLVISGLEDEDCNSMVSILDLYTTVLELAGVGSNHDGSQNLHFHEIPAPISPSIGAHSTVVWNVRNPKASISINTTGTSSHSSNPATTDTKITTTGAKSVTVLERIRETI
jgi:hypothetical protein